jgi:hypothetical protein
MRHTEYKGESGVGYGYGVSAVYQYGVSAIYVEILCRSYAVTSPFRVGSACRKRERNISDWR